MVIVDESRKFMYRGYELSQIRNMDLKEFMKIIPARQRRSLLRGQTECQKAFMKKLKKSKEMLDAGKEPKLVKTHARDQVILPMMVGLKIGVYDGHQFVKVEVRPELIGHVLGEFTYNRKRVAHHSPGIGATKGSAFISVK